jgi:GMP synthase-like glutamine amidotransferase
MKLHWIQHVPFEGLGCIETWARERDTQISCTRLFAGDPLPEPNAFDLLVVMGGPMGIHDHGEYPWLPAEKAFLQSCITDGKSVLGICLGAQLIADALEASVYPGPHKEIGWMPVQRTPGAPGWLPEELTPFHWHGDTFDLPRDAVHLASSAACRNQGFVFRDRVVALQFHLETTVASMEALIGHCAHELVNAPYIQTAAEMRRGGAEKAAAANAAMVQLLDRLAERG